MSMFALGHPGADIWPGEANILSQSNAWKRILVSHLSSLACLLEYPRRRNLKPFGELRRRQDVRCIESRSWTRLHDYKFWSSYHFQRKAFDDGSAVVWATRVSAFF